MNKNNNKLNIRFKVTLSNYLIEEIKVYIAAKKSTNDYEFGSLSDFLRSAILDFHNNKKMNLKELNTFVIEPPFNVNSVFRVSKEIRDIVDLLPYGDRSEVIEKILRNYLEQLNNI